MVRLLGRISDKRIFFEDSKTFIDYGSTVSKGAGGSQYIHTHFKSVLWGWCRQRSTSSATWIGSTSGDAINVMELSTLAAAVTIDWFAIGTTA